MPKKNKVKKRKQKKIPKALRLNMCKDSGLYIGIEKASKENRYVGMSQGTEGNIIVVGGNGSGKSAGIAIPTLRTWKEAICATDVKGELSKCYEELFQKGTVTRPYIIFDPTQIGGPSYDPFWWLLQDSSDNLVSNIWEIALAIIPVLPSDNQPFWAETERAVFAAALLHYFSLGLSFSQTMCKIAKSATSELCEALKESEDIRVKMLLGESADMKSETLASIDRGLRNKLVLFATDPHINHVFRGTREGAECFTWDDLDTYNIFLRIPADKIEQWSGAINLMQTQLIRYLERRPECYSEQGKDNVQTLLLLDEFARLGKLEIICDAIATLRSKNVNICLMVQSVAQLDYIYGEHRRRIIFDNCQYQIILRSNDAETQKYLSELIGTKIHGRRGVSKQWNQYEEIIGYGAQIGEVREWVIQPHELSRLNDVLLLAPQGFYRMKKPRMDRRNYVTYPVLEQPHSILGLIFRIEEDDGLQLCENMEEKGGVQMKTIEERAKEADKRIDESKHQQRIIQKRTQDEQKKKVRQRNYIIGELVCKHFPEICEIEPGTQTENTSRFELVEWFIAELAADKQLVEELKKRAGRRSIALNSSTLASSSPPNV